MKTIDISSQPLEILLAIYNGEAYIKQQLDSLLAQTFKNFQVLIRDDGSSDGSLDIIRAYQQKYPGKFILLKDTLGNLGSSNSFMQLLQQCQAEFVMFCDQDDIWLPYKVQNSLDKIQTLSHSNNEPLPLLVFTDLVVVDTNLDKISNSFWCYQKLRPEITKSWKKLLAQNVVTGCTIIINKLAVKTCLPYAEHLMYDQWLGVMVAKLGVVDYLPETTVLYRQHDKNVDGAHQFNPRYIGQKIKGIISVLNKLVLSARYFPDVSITELLYQKIRINMHRLRKF